MEQIWINYNCHQLTFCFSSSYSISATPNAAATNQTTFIFILRNLRNFLQRNFRTKFWRSFQLNIPSKYLILQLVTVLCTYVPVNFLGSGIKLNRNGDFSGIFRPGTSNQKHVQELEALYKITYMMKLYIGIKIGN